MEIKNILYEVIFTIYNITRYSYLDICVKGKTTYQVVSALEYIHDKIIGSDIERDYIMIVSYDSVSEYYCNKAYPKLNKLERNQGSPDRGKVQGSQLVQRVFVGI